MLTLSFGAESPDAYFRSNRSGWTKSFIHKRRSYIIPCHTLR